MNFEEYKNAYRVEASRLCLPDELIEFILGYAEILFNNGLPIIYDQEHFSNLVGYQYEYLLSISNASYSFYKEYHIKKRNGGERIINEPLPSLKEIQKWIAVEILDKSVNKYVSPVAKAYVKGRNIRDNARFHKNKHKVLCLDIVDFFGSINYKQVYSVFGKFGYNKSVSTLLSNLCLLNGSLPQGSPTSPMLSNLIFFHIDNKIFSYCRKNNIMYTRYADDLSFSGEFNVGKLICFVSNLLKKNNFNINDKKTKIISQARRQQITGIVVNQKIQVPRIYRYKIKQSIYYIIKYGLESHLQTIEYNDKPITYVYKMLGQVNFILSINKNDQQAKSYALFFRDLLIQYKY